MACRTCDHTMKGIGNIDNGQRVYWCMRCGAIKHEWNDGSVDWDIPFDAMRKYGEPYHQIHREPQEQGD